jgi:MEDS: MEthanogen/methylotroph, DcmR Sensory domain
MEPISRHQCLIYQGAPSRHLPALAALTREKLEQNYRCLYLNSPPMVAGMRSYLAASGVDVAGEIAAANLVLSSEQHLLDGRFDVNRMINALNGAFEQALDDGYAGLWTTGDMSWEFGPEKNFLKLLDYEWRLEDFFQQHPEFEGICQYHVDTLPLEATKQGLLCHSSLFISQTLSLINPHYIRPESFTDLAVQNPEIEITLAGLVRSQGVN